MSRPVTLDLKSTLSSLPASPQEDLREEIQSILRDPRSNIPILVALDDDPTGTQTCHDVNVLTVWDRATLAEEFRHTKRGGGFFILTNSRALHPPQAKELISTICTNLKAAAHEAEVDFEIVLRGDSTLRGHFPQEPDAAESVLGVADAWILCPFFLQGGRYTINDVHYVAEGDKLVPAAETPFAQDASFGYNSSNLRDWVVEKSKASIGRSSVTALTLDTIRNGGPSAVHSQLVSIAKGTVVIVNAAATSDVDIVILGILAAAREGKRFLFRTGAAFVSSRLAIRQIAPIPGDQLDMSSSAGGLIIAGSYVPKTTTQLETLRRLAGDKLTTIELDVEKLLHADRSSEEIRRALSLAADHLRQGQDVLVMTTRKLIRGEDEMESLNIGATVAKALVTLLEDLSTKPRYIIAKGGITSSDMATKALKMKRALVVGQAAPGVPLWRCDEPSCKWPGIPYVVFPGNVGSADTIHEIVERWRR